MVQKTDALAGCSNKTLEELKVCDNCLCPPDVRNVPIRL